MKLNNSTFLITSSKHGSFGTGFCIYKNEKGSYLLTAGHVVESCGLEHLLVNVYDENSKENIAYKAEVFSIAEDTDIVDLALIYVKGLTQTRALKISNEIREFNAKEDTFDISGFRSHKGLYANEPLKGYIKKAYPLQSIKGTTWVYDLNIHEEDTIVKGYSGSAIVCSLSGLVLGVATDRKKSGKQAYAIPAYYLKSIWEEMPSDEIVEPLEKNNPYKGLSSFEYKDKHNYYGRERESQEIAKDLKGTKLFTLLGASGSGKSSLIFAGIKPLIEEENITIVDFRPQDRPFKNLASIFTPLLYTDRLEQVEQNNKLSQKLLKNEIRLDDLVANLLEQTKIEHLYVVIDQFEEIFTLSKDTEEKNAFLDQLLTLIDSQHHVTLLISMRSDFLSHISFYEPFNQAFNDHESTSLSLLSSENLQKVIEEPSKKLGVRFQDGLVERVIEEIENEAGQLPLLEFALEQFWNKRKGRFITHDILDEMQSISHSISHYADNIYVRHEKHHDAIKKVLIKLVNPGSGTEDTRRIASFDDFSKDELKIVQLLASERLLVTKDKSVDIVHEALLREWKSLKGWIDEYREFLEWQKKLRDDRANYVSNAKKDKDKNLLTESKLLRAKEFLESHEAFISLQDREFIIKSIEIAKKKKRNRNIALVSGFVFLVGVIVVIWFFFRDAEEARVETQHELYENSIQQGLESRDYLKNTLKSKLIFAKAIKQSINDKEKNNAKILFNSISMGGIVLNNFFENEFIIYNISFNKDKTKILLWSEGTQVELLDINSGQILLNLKHDSIAYKSFFNKDETKILTLSNKAIRVWDTRTGKMLRILKQENKIENILLNKDKTKVLFWSDKIGHVLDIDSAKVLTRFKHSSPIKGAIFSKNETRIISWCERNILKLWNSDSGKVLKFLKYGETINGVISNKNGTKIILWDDHGNMNLLDLKSFKTIQTFKHMYSINKSFFNKDETRIFSWGFKTIKYWDVNGTLLQTLRHKDFIKNIIFNKNETKILAWDYGNTLKLWDLEFGETELILKANISNASFNKDETKILYDDDNYIKLVSINNSKVLESVNHNSSIINSFFDTDNTKIISYAIDGTIKLWEMNSEQVLETLKNPIGLDKAILSSDEKKLICLNSYSIWLQELVTGNILKIFQDKSRIIDFILTKDEKKILFWNRSNTLNLLDIQSGEILYKFNNSKIDGAIFNKDETKILFWDKVGITLWDINKKIFMNFEDNTLVRRAIFNKDETKILSWSGKNTILWDINNQKKLQLIQHTNWVYGACLNKSETKILSWSADGQAKLLDINSGQILLNLKHDSFVDKSFFNKDETKILTSTNKTIRSWDTSTGKILRTLKQENEIKDILLSKDKTKVLFWSDTKGGIWNINTGKVLVVFKHSSPISGAIFNKDETKILSWSENHTIRFWNAITGNFLQTFKYDYNIRGITFSKDEKQIIFWTGDKFTRYNLYPKSKINKKHYPLKTQVETGAYLTPSGEVKALSKKEWEAKKKEYEKILAEAKD